LIRPVTARRSEDNLTASTSQVQKKKIHTPSHHPKREYRLAWKTRRKKKTPFFARHVELVVNELAKAVVSPAQGISSAEFIKGSDNIKKYVAFRH